MFVSSTPEALLHLSDLQAVSNSFKVRSWVRHTDQREYQREKNTDQTFCLFVVFK